MRVNVCETRVKQRLMRGLNRGRDARNSFTHANAIFSKGGREGLLACWRETLEQSHPLCVSSSAQREYFFERGVAGYLKD